MAQELKAAFKKSEKAFMKCVVLNDCVTVPYCDHVVVYTRLGIFVIELNY